LGERPFLQSPLTTIHPDIMLDTTRQNYKLIAIFISTLAAGIPLWTQTDRAVDFTEISFLISWGLLGIIASFVTLFVVNLKSKDMISSFIIGYMLAVITYFVSRILISNMIHPQFLLSMVLAIGFGIFTGWLGVFTWSRVKKKKTKTKGK